MNPLGRYLVSSDGNHVVFVEVRKDLINGQAGSAESASVHLCLVKRWPDVAIKRF